MSDASTRLPLMRRAASTQRRATRNRAPITQAIVGCSLAAAAGILSALLIAQSLKVQPSQLPQVALLWCRDFPALVKAEAPEVPPKVAEASTYGEEERSWREEDPMGYDDACRAAFVRRVGEVPPRRKPLPDEPPGWHVFTRRYLAPSEGAEDGWLVVYGEDVWRCDEPNVLDGPMHSEFDCRLDPNAPLPSPGTY